MKSLYYLARVTIDCVFGRALTLNYLVPEGTI